MHVRALTFGCAGPSLTEAERDLFQRARPFGFILFRRNCQSPAQVAALTAALRDSVGRADVPIMIDQEGGRVARLGPPHWEAVPPARAVGRLGEQNLAQGIKAAWLHGRLLAAQLAPLGITINCAPLIDLKLPETHAAIGDRAFGASPELVAALARAQAEGLLAGGVLPVIKHLPGHGRSTADSHLELPRVTAPPELLSTTDFAAAAALADLPLGMTAHIIYTALDPAQPATTSPLMISRVIRGTLGFDGLLFSDDLSMQALTGSMPERAARVLAAGCDIALHCNGHFDEMAALAETVPLMTLEAQGRWDRARHLQQEPAPFDAVTGAVQLREWLAITADLSS